MCCSGMTPPEGPPVCTALNFLPLGMPPPTSKIISRNVVPYGNSATPGLFISPARQKTFVPLVFSVPMEANHFAPLMIIGRRVAQVSTLLIFVGFPQRPRCAGKGAGAAAGRAALRLNALVLFPRRTR